MRVFVSLQDGVRVVVLTAALAGAACHPTSVPAPTPTAVVRQPQLVPAPVSISYAGGAPFTLLRTSNIVVDPGNAEAAAIGEKLGALLRPATGYPATVSGTAAAGAIVLRLNAGNPTLGDEGY
ncbi:MAG TPA: glycoside hydrolase family 20 zincin-like fold domain-containing protein, partial [Gemmatimonadaceae bacterium]|nr:glycoside hydrolase family 20 zincin-like fold domain-containing protein [Gemmatimonadaceae bacterium]